MKFIVSKRSLKEAVSGLTKVINTRSSRAILAAVRFHAEGNVVRISGANADGEHLTHIVKGAIGSGSFLINFKELKGHLKCHKPTGTVTFTDDGKDVNAVFSSGDNEDVHSFKLLSEADYPQFPTFKADPVAVSTTLVDRIKEALPSASMEASRRVLNGVLLEPGAVVACNGAELVKFHCETGVPGKTILPRSKVLASGILKDGICSVVTSDSNCKIATDHWEYVTRVDQGSYPKYQQVIPTASIYSIELTAEDIQFMQSGLPMLETDAEHNAINIYSSEKATSFLPKDLKPPFLKVAAHYNGVKPSTIAVDRSMLLRALDLGFNKISYSDVGPVTATGRDADLMVFMPLGNTASPEAITEAVEKEESKGYQPITQPTQPDKEVKNMPKIDNDNTCDSQASENSDKGFKVVGDKPTDSFEELLNEISEARAKAREVYDLTGILSRKVKELQKAQKQREKDFRNAKDLLDKLKQVSGF